MSETQVNAEIAGMSGLTLGGRQLAVLDRVRIYSWVITPYDVTHLWHAATFVWVDALARTVRMLGAEPEVCRNVTDVDDVLDEAARRAGLAVRFEAGAIQFRPTRSGVAGGLAIVLAAVGEAMADGSWRKLKACRSDTCRYAFIDRARNQSRQWCSMQVCGNREKARTFRARHA